MSKRTVYSVTVVLLSVMAAVPALAASSSSTTVTSRYTGFDQHAATAAWSATNYRPAGQPRRVVVSGYHPAEGFETEVAAERRQVARTPTLAQR